MPNKKPTLTPHQRRMTASVSPAEAKVLASHRKPWTLPVEKQHDWRIAVEGQVVLLVAALIEASITNDDMRKLHKALSAFAKPRIGAKLTASVSGKRRPRARRAKVGAA